MRAIITGGAGFLGSRLAHRLADMYEDVHLIVRPTSDLSRIADLRHRLNVHTCDLCAVDALDAIVVKVSPEVVFHLAATGAYGPQSEAHLFRDNVLATYSLLRATNSLRKLRLIHTGSSLEPGPRAEPIRETDPISPQTAYAATKAASTLLVRQAMKDADHSIVILRPFSIYGFGEPAGRLIPTAIRAALSGEPLLLTKPGYTRDFVFVEDVVDAYVASALASNIDGELINVATGCATPNEDVVALVERHVGQPINIVAGAYPVRATDTPFWCADVAKASRLLGWQARHTLDQGIARTVAWFRERGSG